MDYSSVILEMLSRIKQLESDVAELKKKSGSSEKTQEYGQAVQSAQVEHTGKRDTTRYLFEGTVYPKNRLVLAVVKAYVRDNGKICRNELKQAFEKSLQGSIGVVENAEIASNRGDYAVRFFTNVYDVIRLRDGNMFVCTQWGISNIPNFLKRAEQLGYNIITIN